MDEGQLLVLAGIAIIVLCGVAAAGWAAWRAERRVSRIAENYATYGRSEEPEPARVKEPESAEERAIEDMRQSAIDRLAADIKSEKPNISDSKAREEAVELISHFGGG